MNAAAALLVWICVSALSAIVMAFPCGGLNPLIAAIALGIGVVAGAGAYAAGSRHRSQAEAGKTGVWNWLVIIAFTLFSLRAFCWLVFTNGDLIQILSPNNLGDLALHLTYIRNLANGAPFWPENPIFAGGKIHYPFGIDVFNALLTLTGMDVYRGLVLTGLLCCLLSGIAFYRWGKGFAMAGFLFNGGLAGFLFFSKTGFELADFQSNLAWKSIPLSMFVTQRGMLYAIPAGLLLLVSWRTRFFPGKPGESAQQPLPFWVEILLYSTMPLFHLHTFIFLSLLLGCWFLLFLVAPYRDSQPRNAFVVLKLLALSFIPATALIILITGVFKSSSIVHLVADWMYSDQHQFEKWAAGFGLPAFPTHLLGHLACWLVNFGEFPFLVMALAFVLGRSRRTPATETAIAFVFPSLFIFTLSLFVMLAPWEWDNTKIMIWPYFVILPFLWDCLLAGWKSVARAACCALLFFSGFISLLGGIDGSHTGYELASREELDGVATGVRGIPITAIFAGVATYNHPLLLDGRNMVAGYTGHLWSHGIDYKQQLEKLDLLLDGGEGWRETARELHARYLFWGSREEKEHADSAKPWEENCPVIAEGSWGEIYDLEGKSAH